ncbi:MAG TPA: ATP-binding cassette domain-containing protein [Pyrinomonadaceae bacterium]|nr:ATP-binding cassette domain-containing protein [Pyrinomonadaceae bacterium]
MTGFDHIVLRMEGITKEFNGVPALSGVDLELARGEVHALVGENGAGKSTLIKIMTGAYSRDAGTITLEGKQVEFHSPEVAKAQSATAFLRVFFARLRAFALLREKCFRVWRTLQLSVLHRNHAACDRG